MVLLRVCVTEQDTITTGTKYVRRVMILTYYRWWIRPHWSQLVLQWVVNVAWKATCVALGSCTCGRGFNSRPAPLLPRIKNFAGFSVLGTLCDSCTQQGTDVSYHNLTKALIVNSATIRCRIFWYINNVVKWSDNLTYVKWLVCVSEWKIIG